MMVTATALLKIASLMLTISSQTTIGDAIQPQDIVLKWEVTDQSNNSNTFRFNAAGFSEFYSCLCRDHTYSCTVARPSKNSEYTTSNASKSGAYEYEKTYNCYLTGTRENPEIYCARLSLGRDTTPSMCISYKYLNQVPAICDEDRVEIMSTYVTNVDLNGNVDDSLVQVKDCPTKNTSTTTTMTTRAAAFSSESITPTSTSMPTQSNNSQAAPTVFTTNRTHSTSLHDFVIKTTQPVSSSSAVPTVTTSELSTARVATASTANNTRLTQEEDDNDNLVTIILGVALGVVVIIATVIIILVVFWRRQKGNPTAASSRKNHGTRTDDYEAPYEMCGVSTNPAENPNSQAPVSIPGPTSYATVDLEKKHRNRKEKNSKKNSKGDHVYNNENVLKTLGKKGQGKSGNATSHVADYYNLDPQRNEPKPLNSTVYANKDITSVKSNDDEYSIVNKTSTSAFANATNYSNDSSSSKKNANSTENSTDDEKNRLGHVDQPNRVIEHNGGECQDAGPEYSRLHETQRHFQNPYNILPDQVLDSKTTSTTKTTTDDPNSSSFNINTDTTSAYSLATPISK